MSASAAISSANWSTPSVTTATRDATGRSLNFLNPAYATEQDNHGQDEQQEQKRMQHDSASQIMNTIIATKPNWVPARPE
jgi:hypothetical protein